MSLPEIQPLVISTSCPFAKLSHPLQQNIFFYLDGDALITASRVCKLWKLLIKNSEILQQGDSSLKRKNPVEGLDSLGEYFFKIKKDQKFAILDSEGIEKAEIPMHVKDHFINLKIESDYLIATLKNFAVEVFDLKGEKIGTIVDDEFQTANRKLDCVFFNERIYLMIASSKRMKAWSLEGQFIFSTQIFIDYELLLFGNTLSQLIIIGKQKYSQSEYQVCIYNSDHMIVSNLSLRPPDLFSILTCLILVGQILIVGTKAGELILWNLQTPNSVKKFSLFSKSIDSIKEKEGFITVQASEERKTVSMKDLEKNQITVEPSRKKQRLFL